MRLRRLLGTAAPMFLFAGAALAGAFTPGNLVIYRVGDGGAPLASTGTAVFLDEYTPAGVFVQTVAMPSTGTSGRLVASGTATTEGFLTRSEDGRYLIVPGYDGALLATVTTSTTVPRVIARVEANGNIDTTTSYVDSASAGNIRSATSVDGTRFWTSGSTQGPRTISYGATTATVISTTNTNTRQINVFADQLYISSGASTVRLSTIGSGLPTTSGQTMTSLPGIPTTVTLNSFFFADLDGLPGLDTLYVADEGNNQIQKWCLNGGTWTPKGSVPLTTARGLTAVVNGTSVALYATSGASGTPVFTITDSTGFNGTLSGTPATIISTAGTNKAFRAIAVAPVSAAPSVTVISPAQGTVIHSHLVSPAGGSTNLGAGTLVTATVSGLNGFSATCAGSTAASGNWSCATAIRLSTDGAFQVSASVSGATSATNPFASDTMPAITAPAGGFSNSNNVVFGGTKNANADGTIVRVCTKTQGPCSHNGAGEICQSSVTGSATVWGCSAVIPNGTAAYNAYEIDGAGNFSSPSADFPLTVDTSTPPSGSGSANPASVPAGNSTQLTVSVTPGTNPTSTGIAVRADLTSIGGSSQQQFADNGSNTFTYQATVSSGTTAEGKTLPVTITDAQSRTGTTSIALTVTQSSPPPTGVASANPGSVLPGAQTIISVTVTPGSNPPSSGITVTGDLTTIGGSATSAFADNGNGTFSFTAIVATSATVGAKSLPITIRDAQGRSSTTSASLTVLPPTTVKISQLYGGGGNSGSTYTNDFIELFNSGTTPVSLDGWSVQQTSATSASWLGVGPPTDNGPPTLLSGTIQPGHYYLVKESQGSGGTTALPAPDAIGVLTIGATTGKVALVASRTPLSGSCPTDAMIVDFMGYGGNINTPAPTCFKTAPAQALSNTTAAIRRGNGCVDTANNLADFDVSSGPIPRNSLSPVQTCGGDAGQPSGFGSASPNSIEPAGSTLLAVQVAPATQPPSTNIQVAADLRNIGGSATQPLYDDGTNGDQVAGDNIFSFKADVNVDRLATGPKSMVATITDDQGRTATAPMTLTVVSATCGVERWTVKVGVDPDATQVDLHNPQLTTIAALRSFPAPADPPGPPPNARVFPWEGSAYVINGTLTLYKKESDVDYHIVVQDDQGNTMVTEIPSPACIITSGTPRVPASSPFTSGISIARGKFDARFSATTFFQTANVPVRITGVGFFDFIHGQTGVAPNGIELHPILDISFTTPTTTTLASTPNPSPYAAPVTITATIAGGTTPTGNVTFFDGGNIVASRALDNSGHATLVSSGFSVGSHSIIASYEGDAASAPSASAALIQVVNKADQKITFDPLPNRIYGDPPFSLTATGGGSTSAVTFTATGNCTISGNTVTITGAGSCTVTASQLGDSNYNAAADVSHSFPIDAASANVVVTGFSGVYDGHAHGATGTATGVNGEDLSNLLSITGTFTDVPGGTAHWTFAGNSNYAASSGDATIKITQATADISVNGYSGVYNAHSHGATGSAQGINGENLTSLLNFGATFTDVPGGTAHWTFAGNTNYAPAAGDASIAITQAAATVSVNGYTGVFDGHAHGASGSAKGVAAENLTTLLNLGATFIDVPGGNAHWSFAGNTNYASSSGDVAINISKAPATIHVNGFSGAYDGQPHGATGSATGVVGENLSALLNLGSSFTTVPGGTAHWTFAGNINYSTASGDVPISIAAASASVQVNGYSGVYDGAPHGATGSATGIAGENLTSLLNLGATFTNVPGGTASWTFAGNTNYAPASGSARIIINPAVPTVTVTGLTLTGEIPIYDATPKAATAMATGVGGAVVAGSFSFAYNGSPVPPTLPGTYAVLATFASANPNYANTTGTGTLTIRGLRDDLQNQATLLAKLRDAATTRQDIDRLNAAIAHLAEALDPDLWLDTIHGTAREGDQIFQETKNAVIPILAMLNPDLQPILNRLVTDNRLVALTAINDAVVRAGAANSIDKARSELLAGDADIAAGRYESAFEHFRNAWSFATKA